MDVSQRDCSAIAHAEGSARLGRDDDPMSSNVYSRILCATLAIAITAVLSPGVRAGDPRSPGLPGLDPAQAEPLGEEESDLIFDPTPITLPVIDIPAGFETAEITDVESADFDQDGQNDLAVAWFISDVQNPAANRRTLTFFFGSPSGTFERAADLDLFVYDAAFPELSVFRNGTGEIAIGDFDGDGDPDLAVLPFFGDELWFIENLGARSFAQHLEFAFDFNSGGNEITPPKAVVGDFLGNGRDMLVYIVDPIFYVDQVPIHFWRGSSLSGMYRARWDGQGGPFVQWTRGLAVGDFDGDAKLDVAFTASDNPPLEDDPALIIWHSLNTQTKRFQVSTFEPSFLCSDLLAIQPQAACRPGLMLFDLNGLAVEYWAPSACSGAVSLAPSVLVEGYTGAFNRGMNGAVADLDNDGDLDLVTRQKLGTLSNCEKVEVTLQSDGGAAWTRVDPTPLNSCGFAISGDNGILRPNSLTVTDVLGNARPEIVAAFGPQVASGDSPARSIGSLRLAIWRNGCMADVDDDGATGVVDLGLMLESFGLCDGASNYLPQCDLTSDGCVDNADLSMLLEDFGCSCCGE